MSVCLCELCLFIKNVCNFELIKINKIQKKKKKKNTRVQDHRGLRFFVIYETLLNFFSGLQRANRNDRGFNDELWSIITVSM